MGLLSFGFYMLYWDDSFSPVLKIPAIIFLLHFFIRRMDRKIDQYFKKNNEHLDAELDIAKNSPELNEKN